jgi:hypothetical protein
MRFISKAMVTLVLVTASADSGFSATNCGFRTIEQCRAALSGNGGFCVPNQFYNPRRTVKRADKRGAVRDYEMPYDPYPWCADYSEKE